MIAEDSMGYRLKILRKNRGMTVRQVAQAMDVSSAYISMIENGKTAVTLRLLMKILPIYGQTVGEFLQEPRNCGRVRHLNEMKPLYMKNEGIDVRALRADEDPKVLHPYYFLLQPGVSAGVSQHTGYEFTIVLEGELTVHLINPKTNQDEVYVLKKYDSIHYSSDWPHSAKNMGSEPCVYLEVHTDGPDLKQK